MANLLSHLKELETAANSTMMADQVLVLMEKEIDKELKFEEKFKNLCSEMADTVKNRAEYIEEMEMCQRLWANVEAVETARVLKHAQKRDIEKVIRLQIMMDQSHLSVHEMLIFVQKLKDVMLGNEYQTKGQKESQKQQSQARDGKDKVKSRPKSVKVKKSTGKSTPSKSKDSQVEKIQLEGLKLPNLKLYYKNKKTRAENANWVQYNFKGQFCQALKVVL
ncbi:hypothetical protein Tco_0603349 [Tanacetum coccineum]